MVAPEGSDVMLRVPEALLSLRKRSPSCGTLNTRGYGRYPASCTVTACRPPLSASMHGVLQARDELPSTVTSAPGGSVRNWTLCPATPGLGAIAGAGAGEATAPSGCERGGGASAPSRGAVFRDAGAVEFSGAVASGGLC